MIMMPEVQPNRSPEHLRYIYNFLISEWGVLSSGPMAILEKRIDDALAGAIHTYSKTNTRVSNSESWVNRDPAERNVSRDVPTIHS